MLKISPVYSLRTSGNPKKTAKLTTIGMHGVSSDNLWKVTMQCQKSYLGVLPQIMHNVPIPVNGSKSCGWKDDFLEKSAGGCPSYDVIAPWPDLTQSKCFCQELRKGYPISCAKFQRDLPRVVLRPFQKTHGGSCITPLPAWNGNHRLCKTRFSIPERKTERFILLSKSKIFMKNQKLKYRL